MNKNLMVVNIFVIIVLILYSAEVFSRGLKYFHFEFNSVLFHFYRVLCEWVIVFQ